MEKVKRVPYRIRQIVAGTPAIVMLVKDEATSGHGGYPLPIPVDLAYVIYFNGACAHCGERISRDLRRCSCGNPTDARGHLDVAFKSKTDQEVMWSVLLREANRVKKGKRQQRIDENGGTHTKRQIEELHLSQNSLCFYCGDQMLREKGSGKYPQVDHFLSLIAGGSNDISNLVIACQECNNLKGWENGTDFLAKWNGG